MRRRLRAEEGMVTVFVVTFAMALLLMAGLVIDGGGVLAARRRALNIAEQAALAGAQGVDVAAIRAGSPSRLDASVSTLQARRYLDEVGADGDVEVQDDTVTVHVRLQRRMLILGIAGMRTVEVTGEATARNARGVTTGDPR